MKKLKAILSLIPIILGCIEAVEGAITGSGRGNQKLQFALDMLRIAYEKSPGLSDTMQWQELVAFAVPLIERAVKAKNESGTWKTSKIDASNPGQ